MDTRAEIDEKIKGFTKLFKLTVACLFGWVFSVVIMYNGLMYVMPNGAAAFLTVMLAIGLFIAALVYLACLAIAMELF